MHSLILVLLIMGGMAAILFAAIQLQILLVVKADEFLVLSKVKGGRESSRVLTNRIAVRLPWEKIRGHVHRGEQILEWERGARIVVRHCDECIFCDHSFELDVVAYVVSIKFELIDKPYIARRIVQGELDPTTHMQMCVDQAIVRPGQEPLDPQDAALLLWGRLARDARDHGYRVISVAAWIPRRI